MNYTNLNTPAALTAFCEQQANQAWLAIDTEFIRQDTYYPILALVQICTQDGELALIDPLAVTDLSPLWQLLADPNVCKVFHSARQDIEVLFQLGQQMPQNLFDTQTACVFLGYGDMAGFARVVEAEFQVTLNKALSRTNWLQRPLTHEQINYALDDVRYLAPLYQKLDSQLTHKQKQALATDFADMLNPALYVTDPNQAWLKVKGTKGMNSKQLGLVKQLAAWREQKAVGQNLPRKWVISDDAILQLAKRPARTIEGLYKLADLNAGSVRQYGEAIIKQLDLAFATPENWPEKPIKAPPPTPQEDILLQLANSFALQVAQNQGIIASNLFQKADLLALIRQQTSPLDKGWRQLILGEPLKKLLHNQACLGVIDQQLILSET
ncbi:ribonuclease D [Thiomicrospira microaerophila]|uniref:ribonuclease D n=1 Tax=Thiomicrospira microaerophila TaxID=406020 RepID=UPI00200FBAE4|nr:ribonuclease D [Thiomicrospira microaerophila]UQB42693.1 ribonuclease D [Thiomicrospira microaerophila]